jgi:hypothetical protein
MLEQSTQLSTSSSMVLLRKKYYESLSFIDSMAKIYGELGYYRQTSLYVLALGLGAAGVIFINTLFFITAVIALNMMFYLHSQSKIIELNFSKLAEDFEKKEILLKNIVGMITKLKENSSESSIGQEQGSFIEKLEAQNRYLTRLEAELDAQYALLVAENGDEVLTPSSP